MKASKIWALRFALIFSGYSKVPPWIMRHHERDISLRTHFSPAPVLTGSMHLYTLLFLVLTVFLTVDGQFIKVANYRDLKCNDTDSYTVFANGKCQTLIASGISSSNINQCSSNAVTTSVYYGGSCSGKASNQASNNLNQCNQNSEGTGSTEISCLASFPYMGNSSSDGLTVTFSGISQGWWLRGRNYTQHFLNRILFFGTLGDDFYKKLNSRSDLALILGVLKRYRSAYESDDPYTKHLWSQIDPIVVGTSCQGEVYSILVVPGLLTSNSTKCGSSACVKTNYGTSTRFVCGNSTSLPGYVQSLNSATGIMFSGMIDLQRHKNLCLCLVLHFSDPSRQKIACLGLCLVSPFLSRETKTSCRANRHYHIPSDVATTILNTKCEPILNKPHDSMQVVAEMRQWIYISGTWIEITDCSGALSKNKLFK
ncbi:hypothetical protein PROFUN_12139 [Planoprotostelium fungivorum]|uniref:Uncharacterized protein n=1 Tax=Planoprotostelium fungivorum TaxID=1890364 RepID=A0A2P6N8B1_9EUKA|nr:hypothetical protein PROFUN_12139 [Planoprotostelium fungivorum]